MDPQQGPPPEPFTQADTLELARYQQGLSSARKALYDGDIDQQTHAAYQHELQGRIQPLLQRQQAAKQQAMQEQQQQLLHQAASEAAVEHQNAAYRAATIHDRVAVYTDPLTGKSTHLVQDGKGKWEPLFTKPSSLDPEPPEAATNSTE